MRSSNAVKLVLATCFLLPPMSAVLAQSPVGPAISYQGYLKQAGQPVNGPVDLAVSLWDAPGAGSPPTGGTQLGLVQELPAVPVGNGLFTILLNSTGQFGPAAFNGSARWLQISVNGTILAPRQPLVAAPYAQAVPGIDGFSLNAADGTPADALFIDNSGRVGIGTVSPQSLLHLNGSGATLRLQHSGGGQAVELSAESNSMRLRFGGQDLMQYEAAVDQLTLLKNPTSTISTDGTLIVKNRVAVNTSPINDYALNVNGGAYLKGSKIVLDAANVGVGVSNPQTQLHIKGTARVDILEISGGADLAEPFDVSGHEAVKPGLVVSIDPERVGALRVADSAYDTTVAGIISGAKDVNPGVVLRQEGTAADGRHPVALTGRVWCWCDADAGGAIEPGTLLTTSPTPGHAMKAGDRSRAAGATLGKAMSRLASGKGLVLVLVNLQ